MSIDLSSYQTIQASIFVKIVVPGYATLLFSDYPNTITVNGDSYTGLGNLVGITDSNSSIRATQGNMSITISGIPDSELANILNQKFKGSSVSITRLFFDPATDLPLTISGNPAGRFQGIIDNWSLEEDYQPGSLTTTNKILFTCSSAVDVLINKLNGRRTNSKDQKSLYPTDTCFDRVISLTNSNFNFGAP